MGKLNDKPEPKIIDQSIITKNTKSLQAEAYKACQGNVAEGKSTDTTIIVDTSSNCVNEGNVAEGKSTDTTVTSDLVEDATIGGAIGAVVGGAIGAAIGAGLGGIPGAAIGADLAAFPGAGIGTDVGVAIGVGIGIVENKIDKKSNPDKVKEACADVRANPPTKSL